MFLALCSAMLCALLGCSPYSFRGSSVPAHLKTIAIPLFDDQSGSGEPILREQVTNRLIERFRQDNSFEITDRERADALLEGAIVSMPDQPAVVASGETVTKYRVTLNVHATYQDMKMRRTIFDKQFSTWGDYEIGGGPAARQEGITAAIEKITEDILNETVSGW
jgi:hypothetical protein